ncbi:helix-turn-helix transcriptional regulator [Halalkalibacterium halodurans]|uniref:Transcriptional regulator (Phage-related) n=1 Tax=Halalkalibacterium halodurans (strain ATCC BAA-125 / DSM 18197 / FERM 7344 / JCM 9153 / C-125) TaxID=272558 RepID=Q9KFX5_HALH5|nr:helix-turn-helix transcriptional regulator [Halalkalibacterium halodurans]MDY7220830.1 helix-turn-helix transcriptional regulator [Halalkalibacterium halodurans]MDY7240069.1 helix-turn-helix transcriptional regulator [Halalkalibacterium halodurans]MED3646333.1 helix-turn-helix transcriptional regulator [Halalkalibacterium halodurans]MED4080033.1 helix-turn-helix transcriptional regulator [Halalkalibacterium halodurans]MED4085563.1 helix-turn-helix transcriptional regulator [Halalkalibacteri
MAELKDRLRELRNAHNLTQQEVASFLNITESAYGFYEQGRNEPSIGKLKQLAQKYNVSIAFLAGETDAKEPYANSSVHEHPLSYKYKDLDDEELRFLDEQLELFRRLKREKEEKSQ